MSTPTTDILEKFLAPIFGADPDGEPEGDDQEDLDDDQDDTDDHDDKPAPKPGEHLKGRNGKPKTRSEVERIAQSITDEKDKKIFLLSFENAEKRNKNKELDAKLKALEAAQAKAANNGKDEVEVLRASDAEKEEKITKLAQANERLLLTSGIQGDKSYRFHDAQDVLAFIDKEAVDIDPESGTIEGLSEELKRIASEKPYLVAEDLKKRQKKNDDDGKPKQGASGYNPGGAGAGQKQTAQNRRDELSKKYKLLR